MAAHSEKIVDDAVDRRETLQMACRLEASHLAFTLTGRLMRDFRAVVRILWSVQWTTDDITVRHAAG